MGKTELARAISLLIAGYVHYNGKDALPECLEAAQRELDDWAEHHITPKKDL